MRPCEEFGRDGLAGGVVTGEHLVEFRAAAERKGSVSPTQANDHCKVTEALVGLLRVI